MERSSQEQKVGGIATSKPLNLMTSKRIQESTRMMRGQLQLQPHQHHQQLLLRQHQLRQLLQQVTSSIGSRIRSRDISSARVILSNRAKDGCSQRLVLTMLAPQP